MPARRREPLPYATSINATPRGRPASHAHWICSSAISGLVLNPSFEGTPAFLRRARSLVQSFGRYSRNATGRLGEGLAIDNETGTSPLAFFPSCPQN